MNAARTARELGPVPNASAVPASLRRAALVVHAMPELDRAWLLAQLAPQERSQLEPLLAELRTLGIPADRALLEDAIGVARPPGSQEPSPASRHLEGAGLLRRADPERLAAVLRGEPAVLVAKLLRIADWPWRGAVLQKLGFAARKQIEQALRDLESTPGDALQQHLIGILVRRLDP